MGSVKDPGCCCTLSSMLEDWTHDCFYLTALDLSTLSTVRAHVTMRHHYVDKVKDWCADCRKFEAFAETQRKRGVKTTCYLKPFKPVFMPLLTEIAMYECIWLGVAGEAKMMQLEQ